MLCKKCEKVIPDNETVCSYCGTAALDIQKENIGSKKNNIPYANRKRNRKKNKRNNITHINDTLNNTEKEKLPPEPLDNMPQVFKPEKEIPQNTPEMPNIQPEQPQNVPPQPQPEIANPPVLPQKSDANVDTIADIERVSKNSELPKPDNRRKITDSSGIIYEIAEELYRKEKTASEIEALCQPPFKKVFSEKQIEELNRQAEEKTRTLVTSAVDCEKEESEQTNQPVVKAESREQKPVSTAGAFILQLVLLVPIVNIIAALFFSFGKKTNSNIKAYSRAFCIWCIVMMTVALAYLSIFYFSNLSSGTSGISSVDLGSLFHI